MHSIWGCIIGVLFILGCGKNLLCVSYQCAQVKPAITTHGNMEHQRHEALTNYNKHIFSTPQPSVLVFRGAQPRSPRW